MIAKATSKFLRISPTKVRQVIDLIRGKDALEAGYILRSVNKRPKEYLVKILNSAIANAKVKGFQQEQLYVAYIVCDVGPSWKRYKAGAFGRATPILKRTCHITVGLDLKKEAPVAAGRQDKDASRRAAGKKAPRVTPRAKGKKAAPRGKEQG